MALFQILQKANKQNQIWDENNVLIEDRFYWLAAIFPPLWLISKNLWLEFILWLAFIFFLSAITSLIGEEASFWLYIISAIWIGFEAPNILARALKRKGFEFIGEILADNFEKAQIKWAKLCLD